MSLAAILQRRVLRVGVRSDGMPWAYRNGRGELVGYDLDLVSALARSLGVRLEVREANLESLERWLDAAWIDLAVGGIQTSPQRVHLALVVPDAKVALLQNLRQQRLTRPLLIDITDPQLPLASKEQFFGADGQSRFDGVLTTAEGGSSWAVLHPRTTLIAPFEVRLASELVWAIAGDDPALRSYINAWLARAGSGADGGTVQ